jgi:hypothetical protein
LDSFVRAFLGRRFLPTWFASVGVCAFSIIGAHVLSVFTKLFTMESTVWGRAAPLQVGRAV